LGPAALVYIDRFTDTTLKYTGTYIYTIYISTVAGAGGEQDPWLEDLRAVGEGHAALDKDTVGEVAVGDEDEWAE
jgi:hypothetical protein